MRKEDEDKRRLAELRAQIERTEETLSELRGDYEKLVMRLEGIDATGENESGGPGEEEEEIESGRWPLRLDEYERYGRQLIVPNFGVEGERERDIFTTLPLILES